MGLIFDSAPLFAFGFIGSVFAAETFDSSCRIDKLLLTGEERVAVRAYFHADIFHRGSSLYDIAASTANPCFVIFRMNACFQNIASFQAT